MLKRRLIAAGIIISTMVFLLWLDFWAGTPNRLGRPGVVLCLLAIFTSGMAAEELWQMFRTGGSTQPRWLVVVTTMLMVTITSGPVLYAVYPVDCPLGKLGWPLVGLLLATVISFLYEMAQYDVQNEQQPGTVSSRLARSVLIYAYLTMLFAFLTGHRFLEHDNHLGQIALITLLSTVKLSDSFAYFIGKRFGTVKLAPRLSPGKTVQGSLGAVLGGIVAVLINVFLVAPFIYGKHLDLPLWWIPAYAVLVTAAGMVGDLAESLIKRDCNAKDSSTWLKGLGGILDIVDSMIFAAPVSWLFWVLARP